MLLQNSGAVPNIDLEQPDGGIQISDVQGKKVLIFSHEPKSEYMNFIKRRFSELEQKGILSPDDIRYVTAEPYKVRKLSELPLNGRKKPPASEGGDQGQTLTA
jgi:hypothetical protein